jgi:hypothetical protein
MELADIMLSEISQKQKGKYCISLSYVKTKSRIVITKDRGGCEARKGGKRVVLFDWYIPYAYMEI